VLDTLPFDPATRTRLLASILTIAVLWLGRRILLAVLWRRIEDPAARYRLRKSTTYATVSLGVVLVGRYWVSGLRDITTFLGLLSAGLAIALKDLIANLAGWAFVLWRRPFEVGDRIQIGNYSGDVIDLRLFQFSILEIGNWVSGDQSTGRIIQVPNGMVLTQPLVNYTRGFRHIWEEVHVLVTFESNWKRAKQILHETVTRHAEHITAAAEEQIREASRRFMIFYGKLTPIVYTSVEDSGVMLSARFLCDPRQRRAVSQAIWEDVLDAFAAAPDVDFAYPTVRYYDNRAEGKPGAGGPS